MSQRPQFCEMEARRQQPAHVQDLPYQVFRECYDQTNLPVVMPVMRANEVPRLELHRNSRLSQDFMEHKDGVVAINNSRETVGSGFFVNANGLVATNFHVVRGVDGLTVKTQDGRQFRARVVDADPANDLALVQLDSGRNRFHHLQLGRSSELRPGDSVLALGHPLGHPDLHASPGRFNGTAPFSRFFDFTKERPYPGMDAHRPMMSIEGHTKKGNSGGPVMNSFGRVIGMATLSNSSNHITANPVEPLGRLLYRYESRFRESLMFPWER